MSAAIELLIPVLLAAAAIFLLQAGYQCVPRWARDFTAGTYNICVQCGEIPDQYREPGWKERWLSVSVKVKHQERQCGLCQRGWEGEPDWQDGFCPDCIRRHP